MAMSYVMDLSGPNLGRPRSFVDRLLGRRRPLNGPWQLLNERQGERMNTIVPAGLAPYYGQGGGIPVQPDWTMRPGANLPSMPTPTPLQTPQLKGALSGITDVVAANPLALVVGIGVGIWLGAKVAK